MCWLALGGGDGEPKTKHQIQAVKWKGKALCGHSNCHGIKPIGLMKPTQAFSVLTFLVCIMFYLLFIFCDDYEGRHPVKWEISKHNRIPGSY